MQHKLLNSFFVLLTLLALTFSSLGIASVSAAGSWEAVGSAGFSAGQADHTSLALDSANTPYLAYQDHGNSGKATVMKFNGSTWETVGSAGFSAGQAAYTSLALDSANTPYVAYRDSGNSGKATVMRFNGSAWETVGSAGFSAGRVDFPSLALDSANTPYVAYRDEDNSYKATVMKFNGSAWETVGSAGFSAGEARFTSLALDSANTPYVAYRDDGNSYKATVMKYIPTYTVSYDANGATGGAVPDSQSKTHDVDLTLATNSGSLVRTGYIFNGWNTQPDGLGTHYDEGATYTANAAVTLYAEWIPAPTFLDVPFGFWAYEHIELIYDAGITGGCGAGNFCPNNQVTRAQMAVFLLKGIHGSGYTPPAATGTVFSDVPSNAFAAAWIEQMVSEGITSGCGGGNYCPNGLVTRAQMAVFLLRAKYGSGYTPPAATGAVFTDVPANAFAAAWIEQMVSEGITSGCGGGNYCPNAPVTRAQMAVFLVKTFNLP